MSRFSVSFSIDTGELRQPFQSLTAQQSARRLRRLTGSLPRRAFVSERAPSELRERTDFDKIREEQEQELIKFKKALEKNSKKRRLAAELKSQRRSSADTQGTSSPSKGKDFGEEMKRQREGLNALRKAENEAMKENKKKKGRDMAKDLAEGLTETAEEREQRELDEHKIKLQKQKDVVDLWNTIIGYMDKKDRTLLDKTEFPMALKKKITSDIKKTYKYTNEDEDILESVTFNYFEKFHPETQRTFSERRLVYNDSDLGTILDPEPKVDFYFEFDKDNVNDIKSMCLRLRNHVATNRPIDYYWLYIEATPLVDGKKAGESNYKSFYTFETEPELFKKILESRILRNDVLRRQKQAQAEAEAQLESQSRTSGRTKKTKVKRKVKRKRSRRR